MANYSFTFKDDSLEHHGIDGQKWGVRNGPPYPLAAGDHSAAEKRAMRRSDKQSYRVIKKANKKSWRHKYELNNENLSNKVIELIHKHGDEIRSIPMQKGVLQDRLLYATCKKIANDVLGDYATKPIYTKVKQKKGLTTVSKSKEYIGSASDILAEALQSEVLSWGIYD